MELGNLVQIEIVSHYFAVVQFAEFYQLHVDIPDVGEIVFHDFDGKLRQLLQPLEDIETSPAAIALQGIG